jgi:saccharopine dehydrogenase (NAD+, L-lysine-forming)
MFVSTNQGKMAMNNRVGIRYEDRFKMERRVAITPNHVQKLIEEDGLEFLVEKSEKRVFTDAEFNEAGAKIVDDVRQASVIFGVKEMPIEYFEKNKTYILFSHTIKGQSYNMPALRKMVEKKINLIDYEKVADADGRRLIFFGRFAGLAGMINSLWALGLRMGELNSKNPFSGINQSHTYTSLEDALADISKAGKAIENGALADLSHPLVIGFTGYGNVSKGAQEILDVLPHEEISPEQLLSFSENGDWDKNKVFKVVFKEKDLAQRIDGSAEFELQDYYNHPEKFKGDFEKYVDKISVLMNCMYWDKRYPKLITKEYLKNNFDNKHPLKVIGDITCDPNGSIECTFDCTKIESPNFVYDPATEEITPGNEGPGILVMAVDILPSELPRESSKGFSSALLPFVSKIVKADYSKSFEELELPEPIKKALILHNGEFTPDFKYMEKYLENIDK